MSFREILISRYEMPISIPEVPISAGEIAISLYEIPISFPEVPIASVLVSISSFEIAIPLFLKPTPPESRFDPSFS